ncbi:hypothetical protein C8J57DRAFT_1077520 [Mycena rebaudengoi]|nr:hypothetical protein C8J57DRAFT_1077520 [Mycena rebaudengoi]
MLLSCKSAFGADQNGFRIFSRHNLIENDASLSRGDFALGDNLHFNETIFSTLANSNPGVDYYNATSAGQVQNDRLAISLATNPNITNTPKETLQRSGASAFYLSAMGDPVTGVAPKKFVNIFFREERLPIAEGWKKPTNRITLETMGRLVGVIQATSNWQPTQFPWVGRSPGGAPRPSTRALLPVLARTRISRLHTSPAAATRKPSLMGTRGTRTRSPRVRRSSGPGP